MEPKKIILLSQDNGKIQHYYQLFSSSPLQLHIAQSMHEAQDLLKSQNVDALIVDLKGHHFALHELAQTLFIQHLPCSLLVLQEDSSVQDLMRAQQFMPILPLSPHFGIEELQKLLGQHKKMENIAVPANLQAALGYAKICIANREYDMAQFYILAAMDFDISSSHPFTLLGHLAEMKRNPDLARKYYRAALCLNPQDKRAADDLDRLVETKVSGHNLIFDDQNEEDED